jgi:L-cysteine desulfidase
MKAGVFWWVATNFSREVPSLTSIYATSHLHRLAPLRAAARAPVKIGVTAALSYYHTLRTHKQM